jgi:hypothetical protein
MNRSKLSALLALILVFASGGVLGAFAYKMYYAPTVQLNGGTGAPPPKMSPEEVRRKVISDMTSKIKLDAEQAKQLNAIMDQTHSEFDALREKGKPEWDALNSKREALMEKQRPEWDAIRNRQAERVNAILREDQRPLYAAWRAERERQRKARDQRDQHKKE